MFLLRNLSSGIVVVSAAGRAWVGWDTGAAGSMARRLGRQSCTDLLVKLRISLILQLGLPFSLAGGTPCDVIDQLCASPPLPLSWFWSSLFPSRWHETM